MESFAVLAATLTCDDAASRVDDKLALFVRQIRDADNGVRSLSDEINSLHVVLSQIQDNLLLSFDSTACATSDTLPIYNRIIEAVKRCQQAFDRFEQDLDRTPGRGRFGSLKKTLLNRSLQGFSAAVARFKREIVMHWQAILMLLQCLQIYQNTNYSHAIDSLEAGIQDRNTYLEQRSQDNETLTWLRSIPGHPTETPTSVDSDSFWNLKLEKERQANSLQTLNDSVDMATTILGKVSRPESSPEITQGRPIVAQISDRSSVDSGPVMDASKTLDTLDQAIKILDDCVASALRKENLSRAERCQLFLLKCLDQRRDRYHVTYNADEAQKRLADIQMMQKDLGVSAYDRDWMVNVSNSPASNSVRSQDAEYKLDAEQEARQARECNIHATYYFYGYLSSNKSDTLEKAEIMARCSLNLSLRLIQHSDPSGVDYKETVHLLIRILREQGNSMEAEAFHETYLRKTEEEALFSRITSATSSVMQEIPPAQTVSSLRQTPSPHEYSFSGKIMTSKKSSASLPLVGYDVPNAKDLTPLVFAIQNRELNLIRYLLESGADPDRLCMGQTPLIHAVRCSFPEAIYLLFQYGSKADIDGRGANGLIALLSAAEEGQVDVLKAIISLGANIETRSEDGRTALMIAAVKGHRSAVELLLRIGQDPKAVDAYGWNALHYAVRGAGDAIIIQQLINAGIDVDFRCQQSGETALHIAVKRLDESSSLKILSTLLINNPDINIADTAGNTAVSLAVENDFLGIAIYLFGKGAVYDKVPRADLRKDMARLTRIYGVPGKALPARMSSKRSTRGLYEAPRDKMQSTEHRGRIASIGNVMSQYDHKASEQRDYVQSIKLAPDHHTIRLKPKMANDRQTALIYTVIMLAGNPELLELYQTVINSMAKPTYVEHHSRLLKQFYLNLRSEIRTPAQRSASNLLRPHKNRTYISSSIHTVHMHSNSDVLERVQMMFRRMPEDRPLVGDFLDSTEQSPTASYLDEISVIRRDIHSLTTGNRHAVSQMSEETTSNACFGSDSSGAEAQEQSSLYKLGAIAEVVTSTRSFGLYQKGLSEIKNARAAAAAESTDIENKTSSNIAKIDSTTSKATHEVSDTKDDYIWGTSASTPRFLRLPTTFPLLRIWLRRFLYPPPTGYERVRYECGCRELTYLDVRELSPGGVERFRQRIIKSTSTIRNRVQSPESPDQTAALRQASFDSVRDTSRPENSGSQISPLPTLLWPESIDIADSASQSDVNKPSISQYLLLCLNTKNSTTLVNLEVSSLSNDQYLFGQILNEYEKVRSRHGWRISFLIPTQIWKPLRFVSARLPKLLSQSALGRFLTSLCHALGRSRLHNIASGDFVRFQLVPIGEQCCPRWFKTGELPPVTEVKAGRYIYEPVPMEDVEIADIPLPHLLKPGPHTDKFWMATFPKKLQEQLTRQPGVGGQRVVGWGIRINETLNGTFILLSILVMLVAVGLTTVVYAVVVTDKSTAFALGSFLLALFTVYISYQYFAWKQEI